MIIYLENDFPDEQPQFMQIALNRQSYNMHPVHIEMDFKPKKTLAQRSAHRHEVYHIVLFGPGKGDFFFKDRVTTAEAGTLVLCSPGELHSFFPVHEGEQTQSEFSFTYNSGNQQNLTIPFSKLLSLYSGFTFSEWNSVVSLDEVQRTELHDILKNLSDFKENESELRFFRFYRSVSDLFALLAIVHAPKNLKSDNSLPARLSKARDYMHSHYHSKISLDKLASTACASKRHFQRAFKLKYGYSPVAYINRCRVSAAKNLLGTTSMSCAEIASEIGFDNIFYFSRLFRKITGCTPKSHRERNTCAGHH